MPAIVLTAMLVVANVMGAGMIVPQVVRLHRLKTSDGVSAAWIGVGLAMNLWWVAYGWATGLWGILPVSAGAFGLYGIIAAQYARLNGRAALVRCGAGVATVGLAPLPALAVGGWPAAGVAAGLCYAIQFAPAAIATVRSDRLHGVSPTTWAMAGTEAAVWVVYGLIQGDPALMIGGGGGLFASVVILFRLSQHGLARRAEVMLAQ
ncbi:MAG: hypothetical protein R2754_00860 [Microthrixaceae bacterium]